MKAALRRQVTCALLLDTTQSERATNSCTRHLAPGDMAGTRAAQAPLPNNALQGTEDDCVLLGGAELPCSACAESLAAFEPTCNARHVRQGAHRFMLRVQKCALWRPKVVLQRLRSLEHAQQA